MSHETHPSEAHYRPGQYRYRIHRTRHSSERYGPCEVCKEHVTEVSLQVEERFFTIPASGTHVGRSGWTQYQCTSFFGHEPCLVGRRKGEFAEHMVDAFDGRTYYVYAEKEVEVANAPDH